MIKKILIAVIFIVAAIAVIGFTSKQKQAEPNEQCSIDEPCESPVPTPNPSLSPSPITQPNIFYFTFTSPVGKNEQNKDQYGVFTAEYKEGLVENLKLIRQYDGNIARTKISPDKKFVCFDYLSNSADSTTPEPLQLREIKVLNLFGDEIYAFQGKNARHCDWNKANPAEIIFSATEPNSITFEIYIANIISQVAKKIEVAGDGADTSWGDPSFSWDGRFITADRHEPNKKSGIAVTDRNGSKYRWLTVAAAPTDSENPDCKINAGYSGDADPRFSPDGQTVVFERKTSNKGPVCGFGTWRLMSVPFDGSLVGDMPNATQLDNDNGYMVDQTPYFSSDGKYILFFRYYSDTVCQPGKEIGCIYNQTFWKYDVSNKNITPLFDNSETSPYFPTWPHF